MELQDKADHLAKLLEERLDVAGQGLAAKRARLGKRLPKAYVTDLEHILLALHMDENPRLKVQIDWADVDKRYTRLERYLQGVNPWTRRQGVAMRWLAGNILNIALIIAALAAVILWRDLM